MEYHDFVLSNGLRVLFHPDTTSTQIALNVLYNVGARDEDPNKTGFAHLFEHLMFGGSLNIPDYDEPLQVAGGENNAYTTNDITNYYLSLPAKNIETAFWLESDRMLGLAFSEKSLDVQRKVVCEEFKEHYINKPYGDFWKHLRALSFTTHPYQWMTIGKELSHVEKATLADVKAFFYKHYTPCNAILVVAGNTTLAVVEQLCKKYFEPIPAGTKYERNLPQEPAQTQARSLTIQANVPLDAIGKTWHIPPRMHQGYYAADLITELLSGGSSSRLYESLVKQKQLFTNIDCYHFGSVEAGLLAVEGKLAQGVSMQAAEEGIMVEIEKLLAEPPSEKELNKVKNRTESIMVFEDMSLVSRAASLAFATLLGNPALMNTDLDMYQSLTSADIHQWAKTIFNPQACNTLYYHRNAS